MGTWIFLGVPWCRRVLNWDCTDYTDCFYGDVDIPWSSVMRRGFLNTDCTDSFYGDVDIPWSSVLRKGSELGLCGFR